MNTKLLLSVMALGTGGTVLALAAHTPTLPSAALEKPAQLSILTNPLEPRKQDTSAFAVTLQMEARRAEEVPSKPTATKIAAIYASPPAPMSAAPISYAVPTTQKQLEALLAPIALYPDQLLSQILMAATYPLEVVEAARWLDRPENQGLSGEQLSEAVDSEDWDPSVKAMVAFPQILKMMNADLNWLAQVGDAFTAQQSDVMESVQHLRREAKAADKLESDLRQRVSVQDDQIIIEPANPDLVYVPFYDPQDMYGAWPYPDYPPVYVAPPFGYATTPGLFFSYQVIAPFWGWSSWDWSHRRIRIIDPPKYAHHNFGRGPDRDNTWRHDPQRRHGNDRQFRGPTDNNRPPRGGTVTASAPPVASGSYNFRRDDQAPTGVQGDRRYGRGGERQDDRQSDRSQNDRFNGQRRARLPDVTAPLPAAAPLPAPPVATPPAPGSQRFRGGDGRRFNNQQEAQDDGQNQRPFQGRRFQGGQAQDRGAAPQQVPNTQPANLGAQDYGRRGGQRREQPQVQVQQAPVPQVPSPQVHVPQAQAPQAQDMPQPRALGPRYGGGYRGGLTPPPDAANNRAESNYKGPCVRGGAGCGSNN